MSRIFRPERLDLPAASPAGGRPGADRGDGRARASPGPLPLRMAVGIFSHVPSLGDRRRAAAGDGAAGVLEALMNR